MKKIFFTSILIVSSLSYAGNLSTLIGAAGSSEQKHLYVVDGAGGRLGVLMGYHSSNSPGVVNAYYLDSSTGDSLRAGSDINKSINVYFFATDCTGLPILPGSGYYYIQGVGFYRRSSGSSGSWSYSSFYSPDGVCTVSSGSRPGNYRGGAAVVTHPICGNAPCTIQLLTEP